MLDKYSHNTAEHVMAHRQKTYQSGICGGLQRRVLYHQEPRSCGLSNSNQFSKRGYGGGGIVLWGFLKNVHTISEAKSLKIKTAFQTYLVCLVVAHVLLCCHDKVTESFANVKVN